MTSKQVIVDELSLNIDPVLAEALLVQIEDVEREFALRHWKYSQLDGGRLCEVASRILYAADSGSVNVTKSVESCLNYLENDSSRHVYSDRQALQHIGKVIKASYKLRSQRGAVHFTPKYTADESDSRFILECCRWIVMDILRLFANTSKAEVTKMFEEMSRFPVPLVRSYDDRKLLQHVDFTTAEEVLAVLYFSDALGLTQQDLIRSVLKDQSGVRKAIVALSGSKKRQLTKIGERFILTDLGIRAVESIIRIKAIN